MKNNDSLISYKNNVISPLIFFMCPSIHTLQRKRKKTKICKLLRLEVIQKPSDLCPRTCSRQQLIKITYEGINNLCTHTIKLHYFKDLQYFPSGWQPQFFLTLVLITYPFS